MERLRKLVRHLEERLHEQGDNNTVQRSHDGLRSDLERRGSHPDQCRSRIVQAPGTPPGRSGQEQDQFTLTMSNSEEERVSDITAMDPNYHLNTGSGLTWGGVYSCTARSPQKTWYGPSSLICFITRINNFLNVALQQPSSEQHMQPKSASKVLDGPHDETADSHGRLHIARPSKSGQDELGMQKASSDMVIESLNATQEEYFLNLFWQSYHTSMPILNEDEFGTHHKSL